MTRVFIWKNNSPQEWEEISFSAFSKARRNGCFTGRFFVETVKMFRDEDDRIIMECSRKDFEKYQQEDRHSRYLQEHEKSRSIFPASHVGDRDGTEEGYQDTDLFVDESVDTAEQAIQNLLLEDLHQALLKLSPAERDFILSYYEMKIPNATCLSLRCHLVNDPQQLTFAAHPRDKAVQDAPSLKGKASSDRSNPCLAAASPFSML